MTSAAEMLNHPYFLVGSERSGTTLLRLMLDHHPLIAFNSEFEYSLEMVGDDGSIPEVDAYRRWLSEWWLFQDGGFEVDPALDYRALVCSFLEQKINWSGSSAERVGATIHKNFNRIHHLWPNAKLIHIVRDPRDVARSIIGMGWSGNVWAAVDRWRIAEDLWQSVEPNLAPDSWIMVRYEDIIVNPEQELGRICQFMGIPFSEEIFTYTKKSTYNAPDSSLIYQWRKKLPEQDIRLVEAKVGDLIVERGYELSGLPPLQLTPDKEKALLRQDKKACRQFRINRYGLPLLSLAWLTRRLPFEQLRLLFQRKIDNIDRKYIK
jgi:Sulfotransferase family